MKFPGKGFTAAVAGLGGLLLTGCLHLPPPAPPAQARDLVLAARSSASVKTVSPWLQLSQGGLELAGAVTKEPGAGSTAFSHLDILFCGRAGNILRNQPVRFAPRSVGHSRFSFQTGHYAVDLTNLPAGTVRIEVRAHDGNLLSPHG